MTPTRKQKSLVNSIRKYHGMEKDYLILKPVKRGIIAQCINEYQTRLLIKEYGFELSNGLTCICKW